MKGNFLLEANLKCPHCKSEILHRGIIINILTDPHLIVMEGVKAYFNNREIVF